MFTNFPIDEEIHFDDGSIRWIGGITKIAQGKWFHILTNEVHNEVNEGQGEQEIIVNPDKVLFIRVYRSQTPKIDPGRKI
jgi:hypothetical protein